MNDYFGFNQPETRKPYFEPLRDILNPSLPPQGFDAPPNILHPAYIISKVQPGAKFVAILRNPTDRLYSDWEFFNKAHDREKFHGLVVAALNDFNKCLSLVGQMRLFLVAGSQKESKTLSKNSAHEKKMSLRLEINSKITSTQ